MASFSLPGISWVQFGWINNTIEIDRKIFHQRIDVATNRIGEEIKKDENLLRNIAAELFPNSHLSKSSRRRIEEVVDFVLSSETINTNWIGRYEHVPGWSSDFIWLGGTNERQLALQ